MNIEHEDLLHLKRQSLPDLLRSYGHDPKEKPNNTWSMLCPFHEDKNPSFSISRKGDTYLWRCFACNIGGTVIDFVMRKENLTLPRALELLKEKFPLSTSGNGVHKPNPLELLKSVTDFYHNTFFEDKRGLEYLKGRGIKSEEVIRSFKIGFVNGSLRKTLSYSSPLMKELKDLGLLNEDRNEVFYHSVAIPFFDEDGNVVSLYGRNIERKQHLYSKGGHKGLLNRQGAFGAKRVILTEAVLDALSLYELGVRNVIPCYGTNGFAPDHEALLRKEGTKEVELAFDRDEAGEKAAKALAERLAVMGIKSARVRFPEGIKDCNDFLLAGKTKEDFEKLERDSLPIPQALFPKEDACLVTKEGEALHFKIAERSYRVLLPEFDSISSLRVNVKLALGERCHLDMVDLYSERQRRSFSKRIADKFNLEESLVEKDLYKILEELEKESAAKAKARSSEIEKPMSDEEKEEALKSLKNPRLIQEILEDLEKIGCVGEESGKLLGYLVAISRKLENPLSMIIVSQSGSGKSNLADVLGSVTPKDEVIHLSRITPQALYYMEKNALKGKLLIIEEKKGSEEANYPLRALQSKQSLSVAAALKDPKTGEMKTKTFGIEGSPSTVETTTDSSVHPENASRCFVNYMDESEEQTRKIHAFQRKRKSLEAILEKEPLRRLKTKHQNMQRLLRSLAVVIPYVHEIHFPSKQTRTRRDNERFLNLIQVLAFLHQHQRPIKKTAEGLEYIEATPEDYQSAYRLARDVLFDSLQEPQKLEKDFYEKLKTMTSEKNLKTFTVRRAREHTHLPDYLVRRYLETLVRMEYLYMMEGKNGVKFEYTLNPAPIEGQEILEGLTSPEELGRVLKTEGSFGGHLL